MLPNSGIVASGSLPQQSELVLNGVTNDSVLALLEGAIRTLAVIGPGAAGQLSVQHARAAEIYADLVHSPQVNESLKRGIEALFQTARPEAVLVAVSAGPAAFSLYTGWVSRVIEDAVCQYKSKLQRQEFRATKVEIPAGILRKSALVAQRSTNSAGENIMTKEEWEFEAKLEIQRRRTRLQLQLKDPALNEAELLKRVPGRRTCPQLEAVIQQLLEAGSSGPIAKPGCS